MDYALDIVEHNNTSEKFFDNVALLMRNIAGQHPFVDCNKRTAYFLGVILFLQNDIYLDLTDKEAEELVVDIAAGKFDDLNKLSKFLKDNSKEI